VNSLGTIEPSIGSTAGRPEWIQVIGAHPHLSHVADKQGINPMTKGPMFYKAPPDCAHVLVDGVGVGMIHWAMDDSRRLVVWSDTGAEIQVALVAEHVAAQLGWHYVPEDVA